MIHNATELSNCAKTLAVALFLGGTVGGIAPASAQDDNEVVKGRSPDMMNVASTPLEDLNLSKDEIPEALSDAVIAPYASERMATCEDISREVLRLDTVLGDDLDIQTDERHDITVGKVAKSVVGSFIPFRGIIREVSGAADHRRDFEEAIYAGAVRRGFLKGLGEMRDCSYPARPATTRITMSDMPTVENDLRRDWADTADVSRKEGRVTVEQDGRPQDD